ncbi:DMT family transporter [Alphaproteobacteria bacterium]|nr:DMT family transporter [Alphaproteobacteria bacterium]
MLIKSFSFLFVILWSSAFITSKIIVENSSPFFSLTIRFVIVALGFWFFIFFIKESIFIKIFDIYKSFISGILFHGIYLGGVFFSISLGFPASTSALIVSLQPILTNLLAGPVLNESITRKQWLGISLGFLGALIVLGLDTHSSFSSIAIISIFVALFASTAAILWQKKTSSNLPLVVNNFYQAVGASIFLFFVTLLIEIPYINLTFSFVLSMSWQIVIISFGAFTILMYLIKNDSASKTSNLFFLVPPVSALMAWLLLDEVLTTYDIIGLIVCSTGVYLAAKDTK